MAIIAGEIATGPALGSSAVIINKIQQQCVRAIGATPRQSRDNPATTLPQSFCFHICNFGLTHVFYFFLTITSYKSFLLSFIEYILLYNKFILPLWFSLELYFHLLFYLQRYMVVEVLTTQFYKISLVKSLKLF